MEKEEIDFIQLEKKLKKAITIENIKNSNNRLVPELSILLASYGIYSYKSNPLFSLLILTGINLLYNNYKDQKRNVSLETFNILCDTLRNTDTYKECMSTYDQYIDKYADFLRSLGMTKPEEVSLFFQYMLDNGLLSYKKNHHYDRSLLHFNTQQYQLASILELDEFFGCYVATGASVCRHMSSLLTDLQNRVGNSAYNVYVNFIDSSNDIKKANHQYTLINDQDDKIYGYCPTNKVFMELKNIILMDDLPDERLIYTRSIITQNNDSKIVSYINEKYNNELNLNLFDVDIDSYKKIDINQLNELYLYTSDYIENHKSIFEEFYQDTKQDLELISKSIKKMVPKQAVKELKIR